MYNLCYFIFEQGIAEPLQLLFEDDELLECQIDGNSCEINNQSYLHWELVEENATVERCSDVFGDEFCFEYSLSRGGPKAKVSRCCIHQECMYRLRMRLQHGSSHRYEVHCSGAHTDTYRLYSHGLNPAVLAFIDPLLESGLTPMQITPKLRLQLTAELQHALPPDKVLVQRLVARSKSLRSKTNGISSHTLSAYMSQKSINLGDTRSSSLMHSPTPQLCGVRSRTRSKCIKLTLCSWSS